MSVFRRKKVARPAWMRAALLTIYLAVCLAVIFYLVGGILPSMGLVNIGFLRNPMVLFAVLMYVSYLASTLFLGSRSSRLSDSMAYVSVFLFVAALIFAAPSNVLPGGLAGGYTAALGLTVGASNMDAADRPGRSILLRSLSIFMAGLVLFALLDQLGYGSGSVALLTAMSVLAGISFLGIYQRHSDPRMADLARWVNRPEVLALSGLALVLFSLYFFAFRPEWQSSTGNLVMLEWLVVIILVGAVMTLAYLFLRRAGKPEELGDWGRLAQTVARDQGDIRDIRAAMDDFIVNGRKEALLVRLTTAMRASGVEEGKIIACVRGLVSYPNNELTLYPVWARGEVRRSLENERMEVVRRTLDMANRMLPRASMQTDARRKNEVN